MGAEGEKDTIGGWLGRVGQGGGADNQPCVTAVTRRTRKGHAIIVLVSLVTLHLYQYFFVLALHVRPHGSDAPLEPLVLLLLLTPTKGLRDVFLSK